MLQRYASLGVILDGCLLQEQCGVTIEDHVNKQCRVTVESAVPEGGLEIDARKRLGETVALCVVLVSARKVVQDVIAIKGPIVSASVRQDPGNFEARAIFTVEQAKPDPEES